jgi:hypothetical protein
MSATYMANDKNCKISHGFFRGMKSYIVKTFGNFYPSTTYLMDFIHYLNSEQKYFIILA